jgi:hypothetical protein
MIALGIKIVRRLEVPRVDANFGHIAPYPFCLTPIEPLASKISFVD